MTYAYEGSCGGYPLSESPQRCDYCGDDIPEGMVCTVPTGQNRYDFNIACPECAAFEIEKYNSIELETE